MIDKEAFSVYLVGLKPHLREQVGPDISGNLEEAIAMGQRIEIYQGRNSKTTRQAVKKFQEKKKGSISQVQGQPCRETPHVNVV